MESTVEENWGHPGELSCSSSVTGIPDYSTAEMGGIKAEGSFSSSIPQGTPCGLWFSSHFCNYIIRGSLYTEDITLSTLRLNGLKDG